MSTYNIVKLKAIIDPSSGEYALCKWAYSGSQEDPDVPDDVPGKLVVEVTEEDLDGLTQSEFFAQKKPVIVSEAFDSWAARSSAPTLALAGGVNPTANLGIATLEIRGGPAGAEAELVFSRPADCDAPNCRITLDGSGDADVQFRVSGLGDISITVTPYQSSSFIAASIAVTVDAGTF